MDDLGWDDVGFRSGDVKTPTTDRLAAEGMVLDQYYAQDACSPSRATFLTGRFPIHHTLIDWVAPNRPIGLPTDEVTVADVLVEGGYVTHAVGKWHVGFYQERMTPTYRGFTTFYGFYGGGQDFFWHNKSNAFDFNRHTQRWCDVSCRQIALEAAGVYTTYLLSAETVRIIEEHDMSKPLYIYLAHQAPHAPAQVPAHYELQYSDPSSPDYIADTLRRTFAAMLTCVDEGLTNITNALEARGMQGNTIIVYTSDNGGPTTSWGDSIGSRNWPLRGGKHTVWEGGTRIIGFIWGPGVGIPSGSTYSGMMHGADWLPTLCDFAGIDPSGRTKPLDGVSQRQNLLNPALPSPRHFFIYGNQTTDGCLWSDPETRCGFGIRNGTWKYIRGYGGKPDKWCNKTANGNECDNVPYGTKPKSGCADGGCLFNVINDPSEVYEVGATYPDIATDMNNMIDPLFAEYGRAVPDESCMPVVWITFNDEQKKRAGNGTNKAWGPWCTVTDSTTVAPTAPPTVPPTAPPSRFPTEGPTVYPSAPPTAPPVDPTMGPTTPPTTALPSSSPSAPPTTASPTMAPTVPPTLQPTEAPSRSPTFSSPTKSPLTPLSPTESPVHPTEAPSRGPSASPTAGPSESPSTSTPSLSPVHPTEAPSVSPTTSDPTSAPSVPPSAGPSWSQPTAAPSMYPTVSPTESPTERPTQRPTVPVTDSPSRSPVTSRPTTAFPKRTGFPEKTGFPSRSPTRFPFRTGFPSGWPTGFPEPTAFPSRFPRMPTGFPTQTGFPSGYPQVPTGFPVRTGFPSSGFPSRRPTGWPSGFPSRPATAFPTRRQPTGFPATRFPNARHPIFDFLTRFPLGIDFLGDNSQDDGH